jgi:flagellar M-ring protein FliF
MNTSLTLSQVKDIPAVRQAGLLLALAAAVALGIALFFWSLSPNFSTLYSNLPDRDAAEVVEALRAAQIPYEMDQVSGAILVPEAQLREARMKLAAQGLPQSARPGIESINENPGFGTSQFVEGARYQHALEMEIARTISELRPVREARVHLAMPKPSAFTRARQPASASVMLQLYPGRSMERDQVAAIVHLVASSIPDLATERVTVIDQAGRLLTNNDPNDPNVVAAVQFEQRRRFEENLVARIQALLEPLAGPGRVSAQVSVDMDFSVIEEARESYQPDPAKLRSEQVAESTSTAPNQNEGIPGATANTPPGAAANAQAGAAQSATRSATRNFEMDRTLTHSRSDTGRVQRITAAVLIDHVLSVPAAADPAAAADPTAAAAPAPATAAAATLPAVQPLSAEQLAQVEALVKQAIGFNETRGDAVSVMNAPFLRETPVPIDMTVPLWEQPIVRDIARNVLGAGLVLLLIFAVVRPALRSLVGPSTRTTAAATAQGNAGDDYPLLTGETENGSGMPILPGTVSNTREQREAMVASARTLDEKLELARSTVAQDPKIVAQVVKNWVAADG